MSQETTLWPASLAPIVAEAHAEVKTWHPEIRDAMRRQAAHPPPVRDAMRELRAQPVPNGRCGVPHPLSLRGASCPDGANEKA